MSDKIFCGVGNIPKKYKLGTAQECFDKGQIRHYGEKSINLDLLKKNSKKKSKLPTRDVAMEHFIKYKTRYMRLNKELNKEDNDAKIKKIKKQILNTKNKLDKYIDILKQIKNKK
jgi:hypothetical protein